MKEQFQREALLFSEEGVQKLNKSHVAVFGLGGVGGALTEALARAGVGELTVIDSDEVDETNINRQIIATHETVGRPKTEVMAERIRTLFPECAVHEKKLFFLPENAHEIDFPSFDYVADAVDTVSAKLSVIEEAKKYGIPVISAMGAGNKLDPTLFTVSDISKTTVCPLAKVMRRELKARGISDVKCVYSTEEPKFAGETVGSVSFVPPVMGMIMAGEIIKDLINKGEKE